MSKNIKIDGVVYVPLDANPGDATAIGDIVRDVIREERLNLRLPTYLTTKQAATIAAVHPDTIRRWVQRGELRDYRAANDLRIKLCDLEAYLNRKRGGEVVDLDATVRELMG